MVRCSSSIRRRRSSVDDASGHPDAVTPVEQPLTETLRTERRCLSEPTWGGVGSTLHEIPIPGVSRWSVTCSMLIAVPAPLAASRTCTMGSLVTGSRNVLVSFSPLSVIGFEILRFSL